MNIGLATGASGPDVARLQRILTSQALAIDHGELGRSQFGPSTLAALHAFQSGNGLPRTGSVDAATLDALLRAEQKAAIDPPPVAAVGAPVAAPAPPVTTTPAPPAAVA